MDTTVIEAMDDIRTHLRTFIGKYLGSESFGDDENIFGKGYVTSLFALQLVMMVEKKFGIRVDNEDLKLSNFQSVSAISGLIERKLSGRS